jgi:hypothetical protein
MPECSSLASLSSLLLGSFVSWKEIDVLLIENTAQGPYSQSCIFFVTSKYAQYARVLVPGKPFQPCIMQHSSFLGAFVSCEENEVVSTAPGANPLNKFLNEVFYFYLSCSILLIEVILSLTIKLSILQKV